MKAFTYIDENNAEVIDLIHLFEHAFNYQVDVDSIIIAISFLEKHIELKQTKNN